MKKVRKAVIPAAGLGTRFLPITKSVPKEMLPIVDKPTIQYIIEEIVASCGTGTAVEVRDLAITLLLARMALRAGDIWQLRLSDIDWRASRLRLHGKSRRGVMMPLPRFISSTMSRAVSPS